MLSSSGTDESTEEETASSDDDSYNKSERYPSSDKKPRGPVAKFKPISDTNSETKPRFGNEYVLYLFLNLINCNVLTRRSG